MLILLEQLNLLFSGFRGTHRPNAQPSHGTADNVPDQHDEADFDIPDTQSGLEIFTSKLLETFSHPMLQFLPQKLAEWIANNYAEELNVPLRPDLTQPWSTATLIEFCRHASSLTGRETTSTPSRQLSSSQTCIAGL